MQGAASPFKGDSPSSPLPPLLLSSSQLYEVGLAHAYPRIWRLGKRLAGWAAVLVVRVRPVGSVPCAVLPTIPFGTVSGTVMGECYSFARGYILGQRGG